MTNRRLRLFDKAADAVDASDHSTVADIEVHGLAGQFFLKKVGQPNIEPRYLCVDGRWRKWDNVAELVAITEQAVLNDRLRAS